MDPVAEIKDRLPIEDVVGRYVDLKRSGASLKGLCPFHQEKTPSFYVSPGRGSYHCFGCGQGGDVFSFVMEMNKLTFPEALQQLSDQAGVRLPERERTGPSLAGRLQEANEVAARFFHEALASRAGGGARAYLQARSFGVEATDHFDLGYAPDAREALVGHMRSAGFDDRLLLAAGLASQDDIGGSARDRFRGRLMFPIRNASGRVLGFGGRVLGEGQPKYLNSPQTEIFDKSAVLFGIHRAQDTIRQTRKAVLVEGYLDAVRAHLCGYLDTVASLGTAVTARQLATLSRMADTVILALDPDPAGLAAAARTSLTALAEVTETRGRAGGAPAAIDLRIARLPAGLGDPDDLIRDHPDAWQQALDDSVPAFDFFFAHSLGALDRSVDTWRQEAIDRLLPVIQRFGGSAGWQAIWLERLAAETGIEPGILRRSISGTRAGRARQRPKGREAQGREVIAGTTARALGSDPPGEFERSLLALLLQVMLLPAETVDLISSIRPADPRDLEIVESLLAWQTTANYDFDLFRESLSQTARERSDELRALDVPLPEDGKISVTVAQHLLRIRQLRLQAKLGRVRQLLEDIDVDDRGEMLGRVAGLFQEKQRIDRDLEELSKQAIRTTATGSGQGTIDQDSGSW